MIFAGKQANLVIAGRKTECRLPVTSAKCPIRPEHDYAVQARGNGPELGRIRILAVEKQRLGDITPEQVRREGHKTPGDFETHWRDQYGGFDADQEVWAIFFVPFNDEVRIPARDSSRGYVKQRHLALTDEPEAVDRETQERFSNEARENEDIRRKVMRSRLAQLREVAIEHVKAGGNPIPEIEAALEAVRQKRAA